jgi:hypothetical protein
VNIASENISGQQGKCVLCTTMGVDKWALSCLAVKIIDLVEKGNLSMVLSVL